MSDFTISIPQSPMDSRLDREFELGERQKDLESLYDSLKDLKIFGEEIVEWKLRMLKKEMLSLKAGVESFRQDEIKLETNADGVRFCNFTLQLSECPFHDDENPNRFMRLNQPVIRYLTKEGPLDCHEGFNPDNSDDSDDPNSANAAVPCRVAMELVASDKSAEVAQVLQFLDLHPLSGQRYVSLPYKTFYDAEFTICAGCKIPMQEDDVADIPMFAIEVPDWEARGILHPSAECLQAFRAQNEPNTDSGRSLVLPEPRLTTTTFFTAAVPPSEDKKEETERPAFIKSEE